MRSTRVLQALARAAQQQRTRASTLSSLSYAPTALHACPSCSAAPLASSSSAAASFSTAAAPAKATTAQIKLLRERTGAPITECRDALSSVLADPKFDSSASTDASLLDAAVEFLRKKGISTAAKKSGRAASEGLVGLRVKGNSAALIEVNSETDFAARNNLFRQLCANVSSSASELAAATPDLALSSLQSSPCIDPSSSSSTSSSSSSSTPVQSAITNVVASLRENIQLRRCAGVRIERGVIGSYMHNAVPQEEMEAAGIASEQLKLGRQGALIGLETSTALSAADAASLQTLANKLAMQVVASTPRFIARSDISADVIATERAVLLEQSNAPPIHVPGQAPKKVSSKPKDPKMVEKMIEGKINKWMGEIVLLEQALVVSGDWDAAKPPTVGQLLESTGKALKTEIKVRGMQRFLVGEGVVTNKGGDSFAKEVAEKLAKAK